MTQIKTQQPAVDDKQNILMALLQSNDTKVKKSSKQDSSAFDTQSSETGVNALQSNMDITKAIQDTLLKTTQYQIADAMVSGNVSADQIAPHVGKSIEAIESIGYKTKPASSPFGFGGVQMEVGTAVEQKPGFAAATLMALLGRPTDFAARSDIAKISGIQKISGTEPLQPKDQLTQDYKKSEQDYRSKEIELKQLQIDQIKAGNQPADSEQLFAQANIPPEEQEDYLVKPVQQKIRGIVQTIPIVERKKSLPAKNLADLGDMDNTRQDLNQVTERLKASGLQLGPGLSTRPGAISDMLGQMKGSEFAGIKADIGRNFQLYRKWATGVAAGYQELNMLAPNYPKATDTNEVFIQKTLDVMKDIERQRGIMLDHFSKGGYAVSKLRGDSIGGGGELSSMSEEELKKIAGQ